MSASLHNTRVLTPLDAHAAFILRRALVCMCIFACGLLLGPAADSQAPIRPTAQAPARSVPHADSLYRIAGKIVNAASGEPVRHASVAVLSEEDSHTVASVESDSEGHFSLEHLPAAKYQLTASKRGYRTAFFDEHDEFNSAIVTGPEQETENLIFKLTSGGVIHGVVLGDGGDPVENARILLFLKSHEGKPGTRIQQTDSATTDDTGAYELNDLAAGEYLLAVSAEPWYAMHRSPDRKRIAGAADPSAALDVAYPVTFYDSTTDEASATSIDLSGGGRVEVNINMHAVPAIRIEVDGPRKQDGTAARAELRQTVFGTVIGAQSTGFLDAGANAPTQFDGVAPGHYELASGDPPRIVELDASANMQVDPTLGAATVSVRGSLQTASGVPLTNDCNLTLEPLNNDHQRDPVQTACIRGSFRFPGVPAGEWQLTAESAGQQLPIAFITADSHARRGNIIKVEDHPLDIQVAVAQGDTRVQGFAKGGGKGVSGVMVVLVPADAASITGLYRRDQSDSDGSFSLRDVAPGRYTVVAIDDGWHLDWADPRTMSRYLPRGIPVTVSDQSGKVLSLSGPVRVQDR